jgi:hypothetical protein
VGHRRQRFWLLLTVPPGRRGAVAQAAAPLPFRLRRTRRRRRGSAALEMAIEEALEVEVFGGQA